MAESVFHTTLEQEGVAEFVEKKSVFIGHACPVSSEEEALAYVKKKKSEYADARHNVWAYLQKGEIVARYSDDVIVLSGAKVLRQGSREEVFAHVDELAKTGLDAPQITNLMCLLRERGVEVPQNIYTVEEATAALKQLLLTGGDTQ